MPAKTFKKAMVTPSLITDWVAEEPGLSGVLLKAESELGVFLSKCAKKGALEAANRGKFLEIVEGMAKWIGEKRAGVDAIGTQNNTNTQPQLTEIEIEEI